MSEGRVVAVAWDMNRNADKNWRKMFKVLVVVDIICVGGVS